MLSRSRVRLRLAAPATTWLAWLLPAFAWAPLAYPGYFEFLNGFAPIFNLDDFLRHGATLAWSPAAGQGYDLLRGEGNWPYLLAAVLRALGSANVTAVKLVMGASILAGALGLYGWARRRLGDWPALLAAAVYAFWPLGLATVYVRGALAETVLWGLLPLVWWAADAATQGSRRAPYGLALALAAAFWTQPGLALWLAAGVLVYLLVMASRQGNRLLPPFAGWAGGLVAGALGLLPRALAVGGLGAATYVHFTDHFVYPNQLLQAGWGVGPSIPGPYDTFPFQLGLVACALAVIGAWGTGVRGQGSGDGDWEADVGGQELGDGDWGARIGAKSPANRRQIVAGPQPPVALAAAFVLLPAFLSLALAAPLWGWLPFLARSLTYPWQLLLLAGPWLAWLAGLGGQALAALLPQTASATADRKGLPDQPAFSQQLPLFAGLIALALLGVYGDLNPPATPVPVPDRPLAVFGENQIALLDASISGAAVPGGKVSATVQWQALRSLDQDYTVFLHAVGPDGTVWGQQDSMPKGGKAPTGQWRPGAVLADQYSLVLGPDMPAGTELRYELGVYQWQTGQRLPVGTDNKVILAR